MFIKESSATVYDCTARIYSVFAWKKRALPPTRVAISPCERQRAETNVATPCFFLLRRCFIKRILFTLTLLYLFSPFSPYHDIIITKQIKKGKWTNAKKCTLFNFFYFVIYLLPFIPFYPLNTAVLPHLVTIFPFLFCHTAKNKNFVQNIQ